MADKNTIKKGDAAVLTRKWRENFAKYINDDNIDSRKVFRGFRIPLDDLALILADALKYNINTNNEPITAVRAYLAMGDIDPKKDQDQVHVLLVPVSDNVDKREAGIIEDAYSHDLLDLDGGSIYNFSTPCPIQCDDDSALYKVKDE